MGMRVWIYIFFIIFATGFMYLILSDVYFNDIKPMFWDDLTIDNKSDTTQALETMRILENSIKWFLPIFLIGCFLYAIVQSQRREEYGYG